jgi:hypothetical protein
VSAEVSSPIGVLEAAEANAPIPTVGIIGRGYLHKHFALTGELTGMRIPGAFSDEYEGRLFDFDVYATLNFGRNAGVQGGYRAITAEYLVDADRGDLKMKGVYFGALLRF